jgi:eukaryotic-like serine/threonine-protein kinase
MELADKSLHDRQLEEQNAGRAGIPREELIGYLSDAADGLDYLIDSSNLLHLDVKPRNLFIIGGRVKVADFGLVKHLERQSSSGLMGGMSPMYAAPETFSSRIQKQSDQYSLAIVYQELLTGVRPFNGRNIRQLAMQHMGEEPNLLSLPEEDRPAVLRALHKEPTKRFPSCSAFIQALGGLPSNRTRAIISLPDISLPPAPADAHSIPTKPRNAASLADLELSPVRHLQTAAQGAKRVEADLELSRLGQTVSSREVGTLRPTILVGVGSFGRRALRDLRHRLLDRLGDLHQVPIFRFLYLDSDPEAGDKAIAGPADHALSPDQVFPMPLQPVANYRRRILDHVTEWLPREKLFSMPRSLQPQGSRALGRLSFSDNYLRFSTRLKREVQVATHPESLTASVSHTGMAVRDNAPRVYLFCGANGGSSGLLVDLAFALRRSMAQLNLKNAPVHAFLFCGSPDDPATPKSEQANLYATLTELNHFNDPTVSFTTQYGGPDGPRIVSPGPAFDSIYLTQLENRSPQAFEECVAHLSTYLTQELTAPLGFELEMQRDIKHDPDRTPFRSFGTYGIWFPRGLMLRSAARQMCQRLIEGWQEASADYATNSIDELCQRTLGAPELQLDQIGPQIDVSATTDQTSLSQTVSKMLARMESEMTQAANRGDTGGWAQTAFEQAKEWIGNRSVGDTANPVRGSRVTRAVTHAVNEVSRQWTPRLCDEAMKLMERPGRRIAAAEEALQRMSEFCLQNAEVASKRLHEMSLKSQQARADVQAALDTCLAGPGFSLFGNRNARALRNFFDYLSTYVRFRLSEEMAEGIAQFYRRLQAGVEERIRDLTFCRQRLSHLEQMLETPGDPFALGVTGVLDHTPMNARRHGSGEFSREGVTNTVQIRLPYGETDIEQAAGRFLQNIDTKNWTKIEEVLQGLVLAPLGGLYSICQKTSDLLRQLAGPLIDQTSAFLGQLLPMTDVVQAEFSKANYRPSDMVRQIQEVAKFARPIVPGPEADQRTYLLVPGSEAGLKLAESLREKVPDWQVLTVAGSGSDLTICREQGYLRYSDLKSMLAPCRESYQSSLRSATLSPHSRFDIVEWIPLEV